MPTAIGATTSPIPGQPGATAFPAAAVRSAGRTTADRGLARLSSEDFFKILISELRNQDPLAPSKTSDMISNVSQVRSIEVSGQLAETLGQLSKAQRTVGVGELIGKFVTAEVRAADGTASPVQGVVTGVRLHPDGAAMIELDNGVTVPADSVTHVTTVESADAALLAGGPAVAGEKPDAARALAKALAAQKPQRVLPRWIDPLGLVRLYPD